MVANIVSAPEGNTSRAAGNADERRALTLAAAWEVSSIAEALQRSVCPDTGDVDRLALRAWAIRLETLASVAMSAIDDDASDLPHLRELLDGPALTRARQMARN